MGRFCVHTKVVMLHVITSLFLHCKRKYKQPVFDNLAPNSKHSQLSYFTVSMTMHDISRMFLKEGKVKITLGVKLNFSPSPHLFYSQTLRKYNNFTFLSEFRCHFYLLGTDLNEFNCNSLFQVQYFYREKSFLKVALFKKQYSLQQGQFHRIIFSFCNF